MAMKANISPEEVKAVQLAQQNIMLANADKIEAEFGIDYLIHQIEINIGQVRNLEVSRKEDDWRHEFLVCLLHEKQRDSQCVA